MEGKGLLTTHSAPIKYGPEILDLLEAIKSPKELAIIHCRAHQKDLVDITKGNNTADREAKGPPTWPTGSPDAKFRPFTTTVFTIRT